MVDTDSTTARRCDSTTAPPTSCSTRARLADGSGVWWQAWNVPDMPWDASRIQTADVRSNRCRTRSDPPAAVQQIRFMPDGTVVCLRDDTGWLNLWLGDATAGRRAVRARRPQRGGWASARSSCRPTVHRIAFTRNEQWVRPIVRGRRRDACRHRGRPRRARPAVVAGRATRRVAVGARTPTQVVVYDDATWERDVVAVGPLSGWEDTAAGRARARGGRGGGRLHDPRPAVPRRRCRPIVCCAGCTVGRPISGRSRSCHASPTGARRAGTCSCPTIVAPPDTAGRTSRRCAALGRARRVRHHRLASPTPTPTAGDRRRTRRSSARRPAGSPRSASLAQRPDLARRRDRRLPGDRPRRPRRAQPSLRAALHRHARRPAARSGCRCTRSVRL